MDIHQFQLPMLQIDPLNHYPDVSRKKLIEACGLVPNFILNAEPDEPLKEAAERGYGFGPTIPMDGTLTDEGVYQYPGDPDLYPYLRIDYNNETFFQYPYAIVAFVSPESTYITRMD